MKQLLSMLFVTSSLISKPVIVGHRGASGYEPENTLCSFKRAIEMGVSMIELDVYLCKSGQVVVIHDDTIDRTTNGTGKVTELSWDILQHYDAGQGEHIPLLSQVFDLVNKRVVINIELKDPNVTLAVAELIELYVHSKQWAYSNFMVSSFEHEEIAKFHELCPQVSIGVLFDVDTSNQAQITRGYKAEYAIVDQSSVNQELITTAHNNNLKVFTYTVNDKAIAYKFQALGIDGIITNYPDILE